MGWLAPALGGLTAFFVRLVVGVAVSLGANKVTGGESLVVGSWMYACVSAALADPWLIPAALAVGRPLQLAVFGAPDNVRNEHRLSFWFQREVGRLSDVMYKQYPDLDAFLVNTVFAGGLVLDGAADPQDDWGEPHNWG